MGIAGCYANFTGSSYSRIMKRLTCCLTLVTPLAAVGDAGAAAAAENFPTRPIRLISPFAPGGGNDIISRTLGAALTKNLGQSIVVDNRPGANTIVAMEIVARATPDGYTLVTSSSSLATNATLYAKLPYDSIKSFAPVSLLASVASVLVAHPALPVTSMKDFIALARAKPGASAGSGSIARSHMAQNLMRRFRQQQGQASRFCSIFTPIGAYRARKWSDSPLPMHKFRHGWRAWSRCKPTSPPTTPSTRHC